MTGKVIDRRDSSPLVLILPIALAIVVILTAWRVLLVIIGLSITGKIWQNYRWRKWNQEISPFFNQLIQEKQGCLTPLDLSLKANLTAKASEKFLDKKAEEYGAVRQLYEDRGLVYYFMTASALGSILEDSDPISEEEEEEIATEAVNQFTQTPSSTEEYQPTYKEHQSTVSEIAKLIELENTNPTGEVENKEKNEPARESSTQQQHSDLSLIQAELAKRLDINASTVGRHKSEPDFPQWSQSKDPEGIAWKYVQETKLFVPVETDK